MSPEHKGGNRWLLLEDEHIKGQETGSKFSGIVKGPCYIRVQTFPQIGKLLLQVETAEGERKVEVEGTDFELVVQKK